MLYVKQESEKEVGKQFPNYLRLLARFPLLEKDMISNHENIYFLVSYFGDDSWRFGEEKLLVRNYCPLVVFVK